MRRVAIVAGGFAGLGLLTYVILSVIPILHDVEGRKRREAAREAQTIGRAAERFLADGGQCEQLRTIDTLVPKYLARATRDPWARPYVIRCEPHRLTVVSRGADGLDGGEGPSSDIVWTR
jgi:hypothetical protein